MYVSVLVCLCSVLCGGEGVWQGWEGGDENSSGCVDSMQSFPLCLIDVLETTGMCNDIHR